MHCVVSNVHCLQYSYSAVFSIICGIMLFQQLVYNAQSELLEHAYQDLKCSVNDCQYIAVQYSAVQCSKVQYSAVECSTVQYSEVQCSTVQYSAV